MKKRNNKQTMILAGVGVAILVGIAVSKSSAPFVGSREEFGDVVEKRMQAAAERQAKNVSRDTAAAKSVGASLKQSLKDDTKLKAEIPAGKQRLMDKNWVSMLVKNKPNRPTQAVVNESAPANQWYHDESRAIGK